MRISEHYELDRTQPSLDFVDVHTTDDIPVFLDPTFVRALPDAWSEECTCALTTFFGQVLHAVQVSDITRLRQLMTPLREPNETHLGLSAGRSRGHGLGLGMGTDLADSLTNSLATRSGLLKDLEDTALMVDGIGRDIISDITTSCADN